MKNCNRIPVVDVFAGAGGLGEGFAADQAGEPSRFDVRLSVEMDESACETLRLRAFFRLATGAAKDDYYLLLKGGLSLDELVRKHPAIAAAADAEVHRTELGGMETNEALLQEKIRFVVAGADEWVLVGGPPCQAYSSIGRARNRGIEDYSAADDHRHFLYEEYLKIIASHWPSVFVMENVPGILSSKAGGRNGIFGKIMDDLSDPAAVFPEMNVESGGTYGYVLHPLYPNDASNTDLFGTTSVSTDFLVESERHGIPQSRHRVIVIGIRDDLVPAGEFGLDPDERQLVPVRAVLEDMPRLRSGLARENGDRGSGWLAAVKSALKSQWLKDLVTMDQEDVSEEVVANINRLTRPKHGRGGAYVKHASRHTALQKWPELYEWIVDERMDGACNSETREHMESDLHRYLYVSAYGKVRGVSPKLHIFPEGLLPEHANVDRGVKEKHFADRFRVQVRDQPSTTVVSHLGRDGHYFIHYDPTQCRSLTVREAARLQTFPDNYYFCGNRGSQYRQVGNAVPPLLARKIADVVSRILRDEDNVEDHLTDRVQMTG